MRNPDFCLYKTKGTDNLCNLYTTDQHHIMRNPDFYLYKTKGYAIYTQLISTIS